MSKLQKVSSSATLFLKLIVPIGALSGFSGFSFAYMSSTEEISVSPTSFFLLAGLVLALLCFWYLFWRPIKWVALSEDHVYVSNYFKSFRYSFESIAELKEEHIGPFRRIRLRLHQPGQFGEEVSFFASYYWYAYLQSKPQSLLRLMGLAEPETHSE